MKRAIVQVPMTPQLKKSAEKVSLELGFSSLQETIRVLLGKLSKKEITISVHHTEETLSPKAIKRYDKILKDMKAGKNVHHADGIEDFLKQLNTA